jgi:hypothetical protein
MTEPMQPAEPADPQPADPQPMDPQPMAPQAATPEPTPPAAPVSWAAPTPAAPAAMATGGRPTGATVITIIAGIEGVLILLAGLLVILGASVIGGLVGSSGTANAGAAGGFVTGLGTVFAIILFVLGALYLMIAFGVWNARRWSWVLAAVIYILALILGVLGLAGNASVYNVLIGVGLPVVVLFFLWQGDVKRYLGRG